MTIRTRTALAATLWLTLSLPALARQGMKQIGDDDAAPSKAAPKDVRPPAPAAPEKANIAVPYVLTFALAGAAVALAVLPSGRTHQD